MSWLRLGDLDLFPDRRLTRVQVREDGIALYRRGRTVRAVADGCLHMGASLSEGSCDGVAITCPEHAWRYHLVTGSRIDRPGSPLRTHDVRIVDGAVELWDPIAPRLSGPFSAASWSP